MVASKITLCQYRLFNNTPHLIGGFNYIRMESKANEVVAGILRFAREQAKLDQKEMGKLMDLSRATINNIEAGKVDVNMTTVERWAAACGYVLRVILIPEDKADLPKGAIQIS